MTPNSPLSSSSADDREIAALIARLLLHFWTPQDLSEGARKAMAQDWLTDLREFGPTIVAAACTNWRRSESRRPTIADIRRLCIGEQFARRPPKPVLPPPPEPDEMPVSHEDRVKMSVRLGELAEMLRGIRPWPNRSA